jgi:hypothetical protein
MAPGDSFRQGGTSSTANRFGLSCRAFMGGLDMEASQGLSGLASLGSIGAPKITIPTAVDSVEQTACSLWA